MSKSNGFKSSASTRNTDPPPGYAIDPSAGPMLRYQASLPRLPVPTLSSTAAKYLETVRPHVTDDAFKRTQAALSDFIASPLSAELQKRIEARAADPDVKSWLSEWWNEAAYMGYRDPVVVFVSYFYVHVDDRLRRTPAKRASALLKSMLTFRQMTERYVFILSPSLCILSPSLSQQLEPEKVRGAPLCMDSYKWLFHSSRYPTKPNDTAQKFDPAAHNHVVFVRKNKFFKVSLVNRAGIELSAAELEVYVRQATFRPASANYPRQTNREGHSKSWGYSSSADWCSYFG